MRLSKMGRACRALAAIVMAVSAGPAAAGETGLTYFPYGAQTVYAGLTPPPASAADFRLI